MPIRTANLQDLDAIEALWKEMMRFHAALDPYFVTIPEADVAHRSYMATLLQDETKHVFVADDGQILGYLVMMIQDYPPIYEVQKFAEISAISVTAAARRQGVGRQLVEAVLNFCRENGIQRVECSVAVANSVSQGFWKGSGFRGVLERCVLDL